jgi:hypothetical protein
MTEICRDILYMTGKKKKSSRNVDLVAQQNLGGIAFPASITTCRDHKPTSLVNI